MLMLFRTGQQVVHHASHWQTVHWTFWLHLLHKHTLSFFRVCAAYFQWYRPLKWRSQSLSFICCRSEHKLMTSPVALSFGSSAKSDSDAFSPTSRASRVIVRISRLLQRSASSNASIQHFPERTRNSSNNSPSNISPFFLEFSTSHDITRDITTFQRLERPASSSRICAVTRSFQTTTRDLSVFPFLSRYYHTTQVNTRRGRSRAQHVRDCEANLKRAKNWHLVHLQRSKGEARRAEPTFVLFSCKGAQRGEWRGPKGRADALAVVVLWRKEDQAARP